MTRSSIWRDAVIYAAAFGPPGDDGLPRSAVVEERDSGAVTLYDLATGDAVGTYVPDADDFAASLAMSPDGKRLALLMDSGRLVVLDVERIVDGDDQADAIVVDVAAHAAGSKAVAFSDSGLIATGSSADGVRVWSRRRRTARERADAPGRRPDLRLRSRHRHAVLRGRRRGRPAIRRSTSTTSHDSPARCSPAASPRRSAPGTSPTNRARRSTDGEPACLRCQTPRGGSDW